MSDLNAEERQRRDAILSAQYGVESPAAREFGRARKRAFVNDIVAFLRGYQNQLLAFNDLSETVKDAEPVDLGIQDVRLDAIRGSMDRYRDFDRAFLPKHSGMRDRWQRVATARQHGLPMPPVELYKLGDIYFVRDGHHRISVCRSRGDTHIQAHVVELTARVPLHPDLKSADLPKIEAYNDFVRLTDADTLLPGVDLRLSFPRNYARLVRHIALFRYLNREPGEEPREWPEAMRTWYEQLYTPIMEVIDSCDMMQDFPDRMPADLYLWLVTNFRRFHQHLPSPDEIPGIEDNLKHYLAPFWIPPK